MSLHVLFLVCALYFYNVPVAQENANIESGKIMFRLVFQTDTLSFYFDSVTHWESALREMEFNYSDFYLENDRKRNEPIPKIQLGLYLLGTTAAMPNEVEQCLGTVFCDLECIEQEINALWVNYARSVP